MPHGLSKEGGGGSPHPVPSPSIMGAPSHWCLPSHVTLLFLYKKTASAPRFFTSKPASKQASKTSNSYGYR